MGDILSFRDDPHLGTEMLLPWYATGQLDAEDAAAVEAHLGICGECRAALERERRLKEKIARLPLPADPPRSRRRTAPQGVRWPWWGMTIAAIAAAQIGFLAVAVLLLRPDASYRTLGAPVARTQGNIIVIFRPDASEQSLRFTLDKASARIVDGPTAAGAYILNVDPARRDRLVTSLRTQPVIVLAQPIDPDRQP